MAAALKCDRCGRLYKSPGYIPDLTVHRYNHYRGEVRYDLCDECLEQLEKFLNNKLLILTNEYRKEKENAESSKD